jgi:hypothetical protein
MERTYTCVSCAKPFRVLNEAKTPVDLPDIPLGVHCPFCETTNAITWPKGMKYATAPK